MPPTRDLTGQRFGRILVIERSHKNHVEAWMWLCLCDCGKEMLRSSAELRRKTTCGCDRSKAIAGLGRINHGATGTKEHNIWMSLTYRCASERYDVTGRYFLRGIRVCDRWINNFPAFLEDMGPIPDGKDSIDRIDNDGNYEPGNCRWANKEEQANNRSTNVIIEMDGERLSMTQWAKRYGLTRYYVWARLKRGMSLREALKPKPEPTKIMYGGVEKTISQWGELVGVTRTSAHRLHRSGKLLAKITDLFSRTVERGPGCAA